MGGLNPRRVPIEIPRRHSRKRSSAGAQLGEASSSNSTANIPLPSPKRAEREAVQATSAAARDAFEKAKHDNSSRRSSLRRATSERDRAADQLAHIGIDAEGDADQANGNNGGRRGAAADESVEQRAERHEREMADMRARHAKELFDLQLKQQAESDNAAAAAGGKRRKVSKE
jgi:hypothetical protein